MWHFVFLHLCSKTCCTVFKVLPPKGTTTGTSDGKCSLGVTCPFGFQQIFKHYMFIKYCTSHHICLHWLTGYYWIIAFFSILKMVKSLKASPKCYCWHSGLQCSVHNKMQKFRESWGNYIVVFVFLFVCFLSETKYIELLQLVAQLSLKEISSAIVPLQKIWRFEKHWTGLSKLLKL